MPFLPFGLLGGKKTKAAFMLKCLVLMIIPALLAFSSLKSQYVTRSTLDSNVAAQTRYVTIKSTPKGAQGIHATFTKSGSTAIAGQATLEKRIDTLGTYDWVPIRGTSLDSLTITNVAGQSILWPLITQYESHSGNGYRVKVVSTGSGKFYTNVAYLYYP